MAVAMLSRGRGAWTGPRPRRPRRHRAGTATTAVRLPRQPRAPEIHAFRACDVVPRPALTFLWGFTSLGVPLVCLTAAGFGFALSFSLGCFAAAFGWEGILLSASAMGFRALVTLPCFFLLALTSMDRAAWLFRPSGRTRPDRRICAAVCTAVLLAGAAADCYVTPRLLRLALDWLSRFPRTGFP